MGRVRIKIQQKRFNSIIRRIVDLSTRSQHWRKSHGRDEIFSGRARKGKRHVATTLRCEKSLLCFCVPFVRQVAVSSLWSVTRRSEQSLRTYRIILVEIFVSAKGFCRRRSDEFKFVRVNWSTCRSDTIQNPVTKTRIWLSVIKWPSVLAKQFVAPTSSSEFRPYRTKNKWEEIYSFERLRLFYLSARCKVSWKISFSSGCRVSQI